MYTLCAVFAHPDDETFSVAGTLARYADRGAEITLITATSGESGEMVGSPLPGKDLAELRERELRQAAEILGINHLQLLQLPDGRLSDQADEVRLAIREALRQVQPQVVITEDVQGITGHPDHIAVTHATVRAADELGDAGPLKLYEHVIPLSTARQGLFGTPDDYITTVLDVESWRPQILAAFLAHRSQVSDSVLERFRGFGKPWLNHYVCVRSRVPILIPEEDLFAGVPPSWGP
jgi:LmbE family N-acetylglucosaminyl deacetylase